MNCLQFLEVTFVNPFNPLNAKGTIIIIETSQLTCSENQLTDFYLVVTLVFNKLRPTLVLYKNQAIDLIVTEVTGFYRIRILARNELRKSRDACLFVQNVNLN